MSGSPSTILHSRNPPSDETGIRTGWMLVCSSAAGHRRRRIWLQWNQRLPKAGSVRAHVEAGHEALQVVEVGCAMRMMLRIGGSVASRGLAVNVGEYD